MQCFAQGIKFTKKLNQNLTSVTFEKNHSENTGERVNSQPQIEVSLSQVQSEKQ